MKLNTHPYYAVTEVHCTCGNTFATRSTSAALNVEVCSHCHPFYTGQQKLSDTAGRVDRFYRRQQRSTAGRAAAHAAQEPVGRGVYR
jgi:large subunit ribosomal protein L31